MAPSVTAIDERPSFSISLRLRLAGLVQRDRLADERFERGRVDFLPLLDVDRAPHFALEARVEQPGRVLQRRTLREGELHDLLVGLARAENPVVRPDRS